MTKEKIVINDHIQDDPLSDKNLDNALDFLFKIRLLMPEKTIWLYTGYNLALEEGLDEKDNFWNDEDDTFNYMSFEPKSGSPYDYIRSVIAKNIDVIVDGCYIDLQKNHLNKTK